jgi:hypothetical protein
MRPPAILAGAVARGAWVSVLVYASDIESDTIVGARQWSDRAWAAATGIESSCIAEAIDAGLLRWDGDDMVVMGFDYDGLKSVKAHRKSGKLGGRPITKPKPNGYPNGNHVANQNVTPLLSSPSPTDPSPTGPHLTLPGGFAEFWSRYPRKQAKADAEKAWRQVSPPLAEVEAALSWQRALPDWRKDGGKFVPLPATYIRGKRWTDAPTVETANGRPEATQQRIDVMQDWVKWKQNGGGS